MTNLKISVPDSLKEFIDAEAARGGYPTAGDYLCALVQEEHERQAQAHLEELLAEGVASNAREMTPDDWTRIRDEIHERHARRSAQ